MGVPRKHLDTVNVVHYATPNMYNQGEIKQGYDKNVVARSINNYYRKGKYIINNNKIPGGEYTIPAAVLAAASPTIFKNILSGVAKPFIEGYKFRGISGAIRRGLFQTAKDIASGATADAVFSPVTNDLDDDLKSTANGVLFGAGVNAGRSVLKSFRNRLYDNLHPFGYSLDDGVNAVTRSLRDMFIDKKQDFSRPRSFYAFDYNTPTSNTIASLSYKAEPTRVIIGNARQDAFALYNKLPQTYSTFKPINDKKLYYLPDLDNSFAKNATSKKLEKDVLAAYSGEGNRDILNASGAFTSAHKLNIVSGSIDDKTKPLIATIDYFDDWDVNPLEDYQYTRFLDKHHLGFMKGIEVGDIIGSLPFRVNTSIPIIRQGNTYKLIHPNDKTLPKEALDLVKDKTKYYYSGKIHYGTTK